MDESIQIPERIKEERNQDLLAVTERITHQKNEALLGKTVEVLCEGPSRRNKKRLSGRTRTNKIVIFDGAPDRLSGELLDVHINDSTGHTLYGDAVLAGLSKNIA